MNDYPDLTDEQRKRLWPALRKRYGENRDTGNIMIDWCRDGFPDPFENAPSEGESNIIDFSEWKTNER